MVQIIEQTIEEKQAMYMKISKSELVSMLIENQRLLAALGNHGGNSGEIIWDTSPSTATWTVT